MGDVKANAVPSADEALAQRLEAVEKKLRYVEVLRKRLRWVISLGALVLVLLILTFVARLWHQISRYPSYIKNFNQEAFVRAVADPGINLASLTFSATADPEMDQAVRDAIDESRITLRREAEIGRRMLVDNVLPDFYAKLLVEFQNQMPEIEKRGGDMADHLLDFTKKHVEERLLASLEKGIKNSEKEIQELFPNLDERHLIANLNEGRDIFVDRLHDVLEERVAMVSTHLDGLKSAADRVAKTKGYSDLNPDPAVRAEVEARLIETLLELAIYELDPVKGELLAVPAMVKGGAK